MKLVKTIRIEMSDWNPRQQFGESAVLGDSGGRILEFELRENGREWVIPEGVRPALAFRNDGGYAGEYDTLPDGTDAFTVEGCRIRMRLVDQITAVAGQVKMMLVLRDSQLTQISSFPFFIEVVDGIEGAQPLPKVYFRVSSLMEINQELERIEKMLREMDASAVLEAAQEAKRAAVDAAEWAEAVNAEQIAAAIAERANDICIRDGRVYLLSGARILGNGAQLPMEEGMAFDGGYVDGRGFLHLTMNGTDVPGFTPFYVGFGGTSSEMTLTTEDEREFSILDRDAQCVISYEWSSVISGEPTGGGTAEWLVNGSRVAIAPVEQGRQEFDVRPFLASGAENAVELRVSDMFGSVRTLTFAINVVAYGLSWNLGETAVYGRMGISVRLTPTGSGDKILKVAVDDRVISETTISTTGRTTTVAIEPQIHGAHTITAWIEVPELELTTQKLRHMGIWIGQGNNTLVVGVLTPEVEVSQYDTAVIRWIVIDPQSETVQAELKADGETVKTLENVGRDVQSWSYRPSAPGEQTLSIHCGVARGEALLRVAQPEYEIRPVTAGLEIDLDPSGHSNAEAGRDSFGYRDGSGGNHPLVFSENFDWVGGGFREDEEGVTALVVKRGCSVAFDRSFFGTDCRQTGRHMKLVFKSCNVGNYDAKLMECRSGNVGMTVHAHCARVSSQLESMQVLYSENRKVEMDVCIQAEGEDSMAWIDLKGVQSCPPIRYGEGDTWAQSAPAAFTIGSEDADVWIYRIKLWGNSLNRYEVLDEYIACGGSAAEMAQRHYRNDIFNDDGTMNLGKVAKNNPELRVIHLKAPRMTTGKDDAVVGDLELTYAEGGERHHLMARGVTFKAQGTSSLEYVLAALNLDVDFSTATSFVNGVGEHLSGYAMTEHSIPVSYFNLKANVASSESCNNVCLAQEYNDWNPYVCEPKKLDPRVRDTVEGHPCAVFFTNTADSAVEVGARRVMPGETILYFVGDMNNSKKNFQVFGQDNAVYPKQCCVEVMNNTELPCRFREKIRSDETWKGGNFEFRFPDSPTEEMKQAFMEMQRWVVSTDRDAATGAAFPVPIVLDGVSYAADTAEYRGAKFRREFADYFVPEAMDFHYLFTDENCMTDNRAKNLFFCYEYVPELAAYRWSVRCDYDNDTALGNDNSGGLTFSYGLEDRDMAGDSWVFNAHDSVLWCNIRDLRGEELKNLHIRLAGLGAWSAQRRAELFRTYQSAVCEALRAEDLHNKYFLPWLNKGASNYASKCLGTKEDQREQFFRYQETYKATQYCDVTNRSDAISMRVTVEDAQNGNMTITPYSDLYIVVMYGNGGMVTKRAKRNTPVLIECPTDSLGDTETYIFAASSLKEISQLSQMKPKFVMATTAQRLQALMIGSGELGYLNLNLSQIGVGNNRMLKVLDLRGCPNLVTALDLRALGSLERFLASGSGITGVSFAKGGMLREIRLPAVSSLTAIDLRQVETFMMDPAELTLMMVENCPGIDTLAICTGARKLERGRITGIDWNVADAQVLLRLAKLAGYDAMGKPSDRFVLTGRAHVETVSQNQVDGIQEAFPELNLSYDQMVESVTVTFRNWDGTVWQEAQQQIPKGCDALNPVTAGLIEMPQRLSDVEYHYQFSGWDKEFTNVQSDLVVTAVFAATDRYYRVTHWVDEAESEVCQEDMVIAHGQVEYRGAELGKAGKIWAGWDADPTDVVEDMNVHAVFITPKLPDSVPQEYSYLYSDDPDDDSAFSMEEFAGIVMNGQAKTYFRLKDRIRMVLKKNTSVKDESIILEVLGFRHYRLANGSNEFAGVVFGMVGLMKTTNRMNLTATNANGWHGCNLRTFLNMTVFSALPKLWQNLIRTVLVRSSKGSASSEIISSADQLFLLSLAEVGMSANTVPYKDEIDPEAEEVTFQVFPNSTARVKRYDNGEGNASNWWLRSPYSTGSDVFTIVYQSGSVGSMPANSSYGVSWACCM